MNELDMIENDSTTCTFAELIKNYQEIGFMYIWGDSVIVSKCAPEDQL